MNTTAQRPPAYEWRLAIEAIAGPRRNGENKKKWLDRAAQRASISYRQAKALWYLESIDPKSSLADKVRKAKEEANSEAFRQATLLTTIAERLYAADPVLHKEEIAALVGAASALRGEDRS